MPDSTGPPQVGEFFTMPSRPKKTANAADTSSVDAASSEADITMNDAPPASTTEPTTDPTPPSAEQTEELLAALDTQRIRTLPGSTETAASFEIEGEDHTLGNALRYMIMKNPKVEFCGYSIPHPSEPKMNVRIQTYEDQDYTAIEALDQGLADLMDMCDVVAEKFNEARNEYNEQQSNTSEA